MATIFAWVAMISKDFPTTCFMTSITGDRTTQKCQKCDKSVKRDFCNKNRVLKMTNLILAFEKKV